MAIKDAALSTTLSNRQLILPSVPDLMSNKLDSILQQCHARLYRSDCSHNDLDDSWSDFKLGMDC